MMATYNYSSTVTDQQQQMQQQFQQFQQQQLMVREGECVCNATWKLNTSVYTLTEICNNQSMLAHFCHSGILVSIEQTQPL